MTERVLIENIGEGGFCASVEREREENNEGMAQRGAESDTRSRQHKKRHVRAPRAELKRRCCIR